MKLHDAGMLNHVLAPYFLAGLIESAMDRLDALVPQISRAHAASEPALADVELSRNLD
jgi:hypothetical protein